MVMPVILVQFSNPDYSGHSLVIQVILVHPGTPGYSSSPE